MALVGPPAGDFDRRCISVVAVDEDHPKYTPDKKGFQDVLQYGDQGFRAQGQRKIEHHVVIADAVGQGRQNQHVIKTGGDIFRDPLGDEQIRPCGQMGAVSLCGAHGKDGFFICGMRHLPGPQVQQMICHMRLPI